MSSAAQDDLVFKALADSRRREILDLLKVSARTTGELCDHFGETLDRCTVMQHIGVLEKAGLVISRREGRQRWNHLDAHAHQGDPRSLDLPLRHASAGTARPDEEGFGGELNIAGLVPGRRARMALVVILLIAAVLLMKSFAGAPRAQPGYCPLMLSLRRARGQRTGLLLCITLLLTGACTGARPADWVAAAPPKPVESTSASEPAGADFLSIPRPASSYQTRWSDVRLSPGSRGFRTDSSRRRTRPERTRSLWRCTSPSSGFMARESIPGLWLGPGAVPRHHPDTRGHEMHDPRERRGRHRDHRGSRERSAGSGRSPRGSLSRPLLP